MSYGSDFNAVSDLDSNLSVVEGPLTLLQNCARRLQTSRGSLWYDPNYGTNINMFVADVGIDPDTIAGIIRDEVLKDERAENAIVNVSAIVEGRQTFDITIIGENSETFELTLTLNPDNVTVVITQGE
jgi:hypothetical protein